MINSFAMSPIANESRSWVGKGEDGDDNDTVKLMATTIELRCRLDLAMAVECDFLSVCLSNALGSFTFYIGFDKKKPLAHGTARPYRWVWPYQGSLNLTWIISEAWLTWWYLQLVILHQFPLISSLLTLLHKTNKQAHLHILALFSTL
jgi:hypothetical protein